MAVTGASASMILASSGDDILLVLLRVAQLQGL
jgi:hypothetical protein